MTSRASLLAGAGVGVSLAYFLDPARGARRRARLRETMTHSATVARRAAGTTSRDVRHRTYGTAAWLRTRMRHAPVDDEVLVSRVRSKLGRFVSHPHAIEVDGADGIVALRGPILEREAGNLVRAIGRVRGVREVVDQLERHEQAGSVPSLQGGRAPSGERLDLLQRNWAPATRLVLGTAGAAIAIAGFARRDTRGAMAAFLGGTLMARASTNLPTSQLFGVASRRRAVDVQKTIVINASAGEVYAFWSLYENFPRFMSRVYDVRSSDREPMRSHWKVAGPAGTTVDFDAEITSAVPNQKIAWKTLPGSPVAHAGMVRFDPESAAQTRVHIRMTYNPPAGWLGHTVASAFGVDPKSSLDADLARMKTLIETGRAPHDAAQPIADRST